MEHGEEVGIAEERAVEEDYGEEIDLGALDLYLYDIYCM